MAAYGEEFPAELHMENLQSWTTPPGSQIGGNTSWSSSPDRTAASDFSEHDETMLVSNRKQYKSGEEKEGGACSPRRWAMLLCALLCLIGLGVGLGVGLTRDNDSSDANGSSSPDLQECSGDEECCNGLQSNCNLRVNEMVFAATHNSMSSQEDGFKAANHWLQLEKSLDAGFRALFLDLCDCGENRLLLCHGACKAGTRDPQVVFQAISDFLDENPTEVLLVELQVGEPQENLSDLYDILQQIPGLVDRMYAHPDRSTPWPLMGELVQNNKTLIMFQHDGPDCFKNLCPPGLHNTYGYMFETSFEFQGLDDMIDFDTSCMVTRGSPDSDFFLLNHFSNNRFGLPSAEFAVSLNEQSFLEARIDECTERVGKSPNLLVVDFWSEGDVAKVAQLESSEMVGTPEPTVFPTMAPSPSDGGIIGSTPAPTTALSTAAPTEAQTALPTVTATPPPTDTPTIPPSATLSPTVPATNSPTSSPAPSVKTGAPTVFSTAAPSNGVSTGAPTTTASPSPPIACNGLESNCDQPVNSLMFATVNNAMSSEQDGFADPHHLFSLEAALQAGFRGFMLDSCSCGEVAFCRSDCDATRNPTQVFQGIRDFLNGNPTEVVIVLLDVNGGALFDLFNSLSTVEGLESLAYIHPGLGEDWPLMIELIEQNKRLIFFQRNGGDCNIDGLCPEGVLNTDTYMFQTPPAIPDSNTLLDYDASCAVAVGNTEADFFVSNHFVVPPSSEVAGQINILSSLQTRMDACFSRLGRYPNFLAVDFWSSGNVVEYVQAYNALLTPPVTNPPSTQFPATNAPTSFETFLEPITGGEYWFQCSGDADCTNGYINERDCFGNDANCPGDQTCTISCSFFGTQYCYSETDDDCTVPEVQCNTAACPNGERCVDEFSFECGARVCKDSAIAEDFLACVIGSSCRDDSNCEGDLICASYYQDCGIGV